jgi:predicted transcriptional regulator
MRAQTIFDIAIFNSGPADDVSNKSNATAKAAEEPKPIRKPTPDIAFVSYSISSRGWISEANVLTT